MNYTATKTFLFISAIVLITTGGAFAQSQKLNGTHWKLIEARNAAVTNSLARIDFSDRSTRFTGHTGCNQMSGSISIRGSRIELTRTITTRRACKLMAGNVAEEVFTSALTDTKQFRVNRDTLRFMDRRGRTILRFRRQYGTDPENSVLLQDRKWVLEQIKGRQTFVALPYAFLSFDAKKHSAGGNSGCNVFGGDYTAPGSKIAFRNIISTMRACIEDSKMSVEREMLDGLRNANRYEIRDDRLRLYRNGDILLTFRGEKK